MKIIQFEKGKVDRNGLAPMYLYLRHQGEQIRIYTGVSFNPWNWDAFRVRLYKPNNQREYKFQHWCDNQYKPFADTVISMRMANCSVEDLREVMTRCANELRNSLRAEAASNLTPLQAMVKEYFKVYTHYQESSARKFDETTNRLIRYGFDNLDYFSNIQNLHDILEDMIELGRSNNTLNGFLSHNRLLANFLRDFHTEYEVDKTFFSIKNYPKTPPAPVFLTKPEIAAMRDLPKLNKMEESAWDCFDFHCNTGLRYSDKNKVIRESLRYDSDSGMKWAMVHTRKGQKDVQIQVNPRAEKLLEKYDYEFPSYGLGHYNKLLKNMAERAGLNEPVEVVSLTGRTQAKRSTAPKHTRISSHVARRTFARLMFDAGVRVDEIMIKLGHNDTSTTLRYIGAPETKVIKEQFDLTG